MADKGFEIAGDLPVGVGPLASSLFCLVIFFLEHNVSKHHYGLQLFDSIALQKRLALLDFVRLFARTLISSSLKCNGSGGVTQK